MGIKEKKYKKLVKDLRRTTEILKIIFIIDFIIRKRKKIIRR